MHCGSVVHSNDAFRWMWAIAQRAVWPYDVIMEAPFFYQDLGLPQAMEYFTFDQLLPELSLKFSQYPFSQRKPGSI